jgi:hypothetical protein
LQRSCSLVRFEVFTAVTMKKAVFWDVAPCRSCVNRRFGGTYRLHLQGRCLTSLTDASRADFLIFPSTLKMETIRSSNTLDYTRSTRRHIPEDDILHSHRLENLKSYIDSTMYYIPGESIVGDAWKSQLSKVSSNNCISQRSKNWDSFKRCWLDPEGLHISPPGVSILHQHISVMAAANFTDNFLICV